MGEGPGADCLICHQKSGKGEKIEKRKKRKRKGKRGKEKKEREGKGKKKEEKWERKENERREREREERKKRKERGNKHCFNRTINISNDINFAYKYSPNCTNSVRKLQNLLAPQGRTSPQIPPVHAQARTGRATGKPSKSCHPPPPTVRAGYVPGVVSVRGGVRVNH